jgi:hypothetical protein
LVLLSSRLTPAATSSSRQSGMLPRLTAGANLPFRRRGVDRSFYAGDVPAYLWIAITIATSLAAAYVWWLRRSKHRASQPSQDKLQQAAKAAEVLRRRTPKARRDTFERGQRPRTRYPGPLMKNAALGDAADAASDSSE